MNGPSRCRDLKTPPTSERSFGISDYCLSVYRTIGISRYKKYLYVSSCVLIFYCLNVDRSVYVLAVYVLYTCNSLTGVCVKKKWGKNVVRGMCYPKINI